ncbi:hypothetical protein [Cellulomonas sp. B6]|uniref:hypothetical protein n=1 Tax=Cellulomonas sp. B6 TaxID=1295626 RepID=UPI001237757B|nr:hypothetical protein [Cellulomonas sp. B6]
MRAEIENLSGKKGPSGVLIDSADARAVRLFVTCAPYSADVEMGMSVPGDPLLVVYDGETVGTTISPEVIRQLVPALSSARWEELEEQPSLWQRWRRHVASWRGTRDGSETSDREGPRS